MKNPIEYNNPYAEWLAGKPFRVYYERGRKGPYIQVHVWRSRKTMVKMCRSRYINDHTAAFFSGIERIEGYHRGRWTWLDRNGRWGDIHIPLSYIRVGVISHECFHALLWYVMRKHLADDRKAMRRNEERMAWVLGNLTRQAVNGCHSVWNSYNKKRKK